MRTLDYQKIDGIPQIPGFYYVDDEEFETLTIVGIAELDSEIIGVSLGYDQFMREDDMADMIFYGPIPLPEEAKFEPEWRDYD